MSDVDRFHAATRRQPELLAGLKSLKTAEDVAAFARDLGYQFSTEELNQWTESKQGELSNADLHNVVGGLMSDTKFLSHDQTGGTTAEYLYYRLFC